LRRKLRRMGNFFAFCPRPATLGPQVMRRGRENLGSASGFEPFVGFSFLTEFFNLTSGSLLKMISKIAIRTHLQHKSACGYFAVLS